VRRIGCFLSDTLEEQGVTVRIRGTRVVRVRERFLVVRIGDEARYERFDLARIHVGAEASTAFGLTLVFRSVSMQLLAPSSWEAASPYFSRTRWRASGRCRRAST